MEQYRWCPVAPDQMAVLPGAVSDRCLKLATVEQLRVLLWFSRHPGDFDPAACGQALGMSEDECRGQLSFWVGQGILTTASEDTSPAAPVERLARPAAVKPQLREVVEYQKKHPAFSDFAQAASARLGKPIGHGETATLLYLHDTVGLPMEVILMEIAYAVSIGKGNMRYVEKIALDWADEDRTTVEAVDEYIRLLEEQQRCAALVGAWLETSRPLTANQAIFAYRWTREWGFSEEMIRRGAAITREKIPTVSAKFFAYLDKILEGWREEGIDRPEKIPTPVTKKKGAEATNPEHSSLDLDGLDAELMRYTPVFKPKK